MFADDKVCGFCGHVLGTEVDTASWSEPRVYRFSVAVLVACWFLFGGLAIATGWTAMFYVGGNGPPGRWMMGAMALIFAGIVAAATYSWRVKRVTLLPNCVEWVGAWGGAQSCPYTELTVVEQPGYKSGPVFKIGRDGGPYFEVNSDPANYKELADELRLRSSIVRQRAKGSP